MRKNIPKIKKRLQDFLCDESGKITKKDALGISIGAVLLSWGVETTFAGSTYTQSQSPSTSMYPSNSSVYTPPTNPGHSNAASKEYIEVSSVTCNHSSGVVNGHFSSVPTVDTSGGTIYTLTNTHGSHWSHGSHGSHGSHWQW